MNGSYVKTIFCIDLQVKIINMTNNQNNMNITPTPTPSPLDRLVNMFYETRAETIEESEDRRFEGLMKHVKSSYKKPVWAVNAVENTHNGWFYTTIDRTIEIAGDLDTTKNRIPKWMATESVDELIESDKKIMDSLTTKIELLVGSVDIIFEKCTVKEPKRIISLSTGCLINLAIQIYDFEGDNQEEFNKIIRTHIDPGYVEPPEGVLRERLLEFVKVILELD
jgi:hypothetical protein